MTTAHLGNGVHQVSFSRFRFKLTMPLVEMPLIARLGPFPSELLGLRLAELIAPTPDGFIAQLYSPERHHQLDFSQAHTEVEVQPDAL